MGDCILSDADLAVIRPSFSPDDPPADDPPNVRSAIEALDLTPHIEGGFFRLTDVSPTTVASPYPVDNLSDHTVALAGGVRETPDSLPRLPGFEPSLRRSSTTIFYYLTPRRPLGSFHRNRSRIVHTLHRGRGRYVLIHPAGDGRPARVETFVVGQRVEDGERLQWVVDGSVWKASFLLNEEGGAARDNQGLLISETVVPGFEYADHEFLGVDVLRKLLPSAAADKLEWLVREAQHH